MAGDEADLLSQDELDELFNAGGDEDEDDDNSFSISKIQQSTGFLKDEEGHLIHEQSQILAGKLEKMIQGCIKYNVHIGRFI